MLQTMILILNLIDYLIKFLRFLVKKYKKRNSKIKSKKLKKKKIKFKKK